MTSKGFSKQLQLLPLEATEKDKCTVWPRTSNVSVRMSLDRGHPELVTG